MTIYCILPYVCDVCAHTYSTYSINYKTQTRIFLPYLLRSSFVVSPELRSSTCCTTSVAQTRAFHQLCYYSSSNLLRANAQVLPLIQVSIDDRYPMTYLLLLKVCRMYLRKACLYAATSARIVHRKHKNTTYCKGPTTCTIQNSRSRVLLVVHLLYLTYSTSKKCGRWCRRIALCTRDFCARAINSRDRLLHHR